MDALLTAVILGMVTGTVSLTITRTYVFRTPRNWLRRRGEWFDKLITCPYCTSHYVAAFFVAFYRPKLVDSFFLVDLAVSWFFVVVTSALTVGLLWRSLSVIGEAPDLPENQEDDEDE